MKKLIGRLTTLAMTAGLFVLPAFASGVHRFKCERTSVDPHNTGRQCTSTPVLALVPVKTTGNNICKPVYKPKKTCNTSLTVTLSLTAD